MSKQAKKGLIAGVLAITMGVAVYTLIDMANAGAAFQFSFINHALVPVIGGTVFGLLNYFIPDKAENK